MINSLQKPFMFIGKSCKKLQKTGFTKIRVHAYPMKIAQSYFNLYLTLFWKFFPIIFPRLRRSWQFLGFFSDFCAISVLATYWKIFVTFIFEVTYLQNIIEYYKSPQNRLLLRVLTYFFRNYNNYYRLAKLNIGFSFVIN